jgi:hypothetical protein
MNKQYEMNVLIITTVGAESLFRGTFAIDLKSLKLS